VALEPQRVTEFAARPLSTLEYGQAALVQPETPLSDAIAAMRGGDHSCVLVVANGALQGIITERDVLCKFMEPGVDWNGPVQAVMTAAPASLAGTATIREAITLMRERDFRTVPVVDGGEVRGAIRLGDLLRHLAESFPEEILNLPPRPHQTMEKAEGA